MKLGLGLSLGTGASHGLVNTGATNLFTGAQAFDGGSWVKGATTVSADAVLAPDGSLTADKIIPTAAAANHNVQNLLSAGAGTFTVSVFVKAAGYPRLGVRVYDGAAYRIRGTFNISTGVIVATEAGTLGIKDAGNGWFLISGTGTTAASMGASVGWIFEPLGAANVVQDSWTGDGTSGVYLWQAQAVAGSAIGPFDYT